MSLAVRTGFIEDFNDKLFIAVQQKASKLRQYVNLATINGDYLYIDDIGTVSLTKNDNAFAALNNQEIEYNRRRISSSRYVMSPMLDMNQVSRLVNEEGYMNQVIAQMGAAAQRKIDEVIVDALSATVYDKSGVSTSFTSDGGITVDATSGVTFDNWMSAKQELEEIGFGIDEQSGLLFACTPQERNVLEKEVEVSSMDFHQSFGVQKDTKGNLIGMKGVDFKVFSNNPQKNISPILNVTSSVRDCFFFNTQGGEGMQSAITLGFQKRGEYKFELVELKETKFETWVLKGIIKVGAVRNPNSGVVKFQTTAS